MHGARRVKDRDTIKTQERHDKDTRRRVSILFWCLYSCLLTLSYITLKNDQTPFKNLRCSHRKIFKGYFRCKSIFAIT